MSVYRDHAWLFIFSAAAFNASGAPITGFLWNVTDLVAQNAILANVPGTPPNVTFSVNSPLNFDNGGSVNDFLTSGGAFNIVGSVADLSRSISPSLLEFIGMVSVTNGQQFTVTHDDGLTLNIGGLDVITASGPTPPTHTTATYTGPTGNLPFTLVYGECCGGSAVLQIGLPLQPASGTPEPGSFGLIAGGLPTLGSLYSRTHRPMRRRMGVS